MIIKRRLKTLENKTGEKIKAQLKRMLHDHEKYKKCFFWNVNMCASQRRSNEFDQEISFLLNNKKYEWKQSLEISCKNFYWSSAIYIDDKKSNIKSIKKIIA